MINIKGRNSPNQLVTERRGDSEARQDSQMCQRRHDEKQDWRQCCVSADGEEMRTRQLPQQHMGQSPT